MKTKFYLFQQRGITESFYCGNIYEALPTDDIRYHGMPTTFQECVKMEVCKEFETRKEANGYSRSEEVAMEDSNNYAQRAMRDEEIFGVEGVDNCLNDN